MNACESYYRYVRHSSIEDMEAKGWVVCDRLNGTHHGHYSVLMRWNGEGKPG